LNTTKVEKEHVEDEKKVVTKLHKDAESRYKKLRKKYHHYKSKVRQYLKQLTFVPLLRDLAWAQVFNWGFENFKNLVLNPDRFNFLPKIMSPIFLRVPDQGIFELKDMGVEDVPDVLDWSQNAPSPQRTYVPPHPSTSEPLFDMATEGDEDDKL
jgi:hypothetical protein